MIIEKIIKNISKYLDKSIDKHLNNKLYHSDVCFYCIEEKCLPSYEQCIKRIKFENSK